MLKSWAKFFRIVNLPTVPGDVLAGAAAFVVSGNAPASLTAAFAASAASILIYMFGLADNDIVGAKTDVGRPIPDGEIPLRAARIAAFLCLVGAAAAGGAAHLSAPWWIVAAALTLCIVVYNRTKWWWAMGLCRGLNVVCGAAAAAGQSFCHDGELRPRLATLAVAAVWTLYIAGVTRYSEGEENDPAKKRRVGLLIGSLVYLQLIALVVFPVKPFLIAGAVLLALLRIAKSLFPEVGAS